MDLTKTEIAINKYGKTLVADIIAKLKKTNASASGNLIKSLTYKLGEGIEELMVQVEADDYFKYVDEGRRRGEQPPLAAIKKWVAIKGLPPASAYPIAKKIGKFGIKPKNILRDILKPNTITKDDDILAEAFKQDLENYIDKNIIK